MPGIPAEPHPQEALRLTALRRQRVLDTAAEDRFDRITRLAAKFFGTKIALISLVDANRQWFKSRVGLDADQTSRELSFCAHAILDEDPLVIPDTLADPRFRDNALVTGDPKIRFYAGAPLITSDGYPLGTLCIIDDKPRGWLSEEDLATLKDLADLALVEIERLGEAKDAFSKALSRQDRSEATAVSPESLTILIETTPAPLLMTDETGGILAVTAQWRQLFGVSGKALIRRPIEDVMPGYCAVWAPRFGRILAGETVMLAETDLTPQERAQGIKGWHGVPWRTWEGKIGGAVIFAGNDDGLFGRIGWMEETEQMAALGRLAVGMSHDVANLLGVLSGTIELLRLEAAESGNGDLLEALEAVIRRGRDLTRRLRSLSTGKEDRVEAINTAAQIESLVEVIRAGLPKTTTLTLSMAPDLPPISVLPGRFDAALLNLVANARDAMEGRTGSIHMVVSALSPDDWPLGVEGLELRVADEGIGMSEDVRQRLFEPFFTTKARGAGSGLGLVQIRNFMHACGGTVDVKSREGAGTTVILRFPAYNGADQLVNDAAC
ncbi:MAG: ATP-binding protein [Alphaproteobacteria bacterium]|nr:ATP-binding protein [Alphaproteobacteria bacterium]